MAAIGSPEAPAGIAGSESAKGAHLAAADWLRGIRKRNELLPGIQTYDEYLIRTTIGLYRAKQFLRNESALVPNTDTMREAHRIAFGDVVRHGGVFRRLNDQLHTPGAGAAARVGAEFRRTIAEMNHLLRHAKSPVDQIAAVAYFHARFVAVQPFRDGNKRLGLLLTEMQLEKITGNPAQAVVQGIYNDRARYEAALNDSFARNDLTALTRVFGAAAGIEIPNGLEVRAPARIAPRLNATILTEDSLVAELQAAALTPTWASDVLKTPKSEALQSPAERSESAPAQGAAISDRVLLAELTTIRKSHQRPQVPVSTEAGEKSVETILQNLAGPDLSVAGIRLQDEAKRYVRGEIDEMRMSRAIREHVSALEISNRATEERTASYPVSIAPARMQRHVSMDEKRYRAAVFPIETEFLSALEILREPLIAGDNERRATTLSQARDWVDNLGGSGVTRVPLRCAVEKYLLGKEGRESVQRRLREHCAKNQNLRSARLDLSRVARSGVER